MVVSQSGSGRRCPDTFDDLSHGAQNFIQGLPASQTLSKRPIARQTSGAGQNEVSHAGQTAEGLGVRPKGDTETSDFVQTAGHQCRLGVESQAEPVDNPCGNSNHVFECPGEFNTDQVGTHIAAKVVIGKLLLESCRKFEVWTGENRGRRVSPDDFACKGGPRETTESVWLEIQGLTRYFVHPPKGLGLDSLRGGN